MTMTAPAARIRLCALFALGWFFWPGAARADHTVELVVDREDAAVSGSIRLHPAFTTVIYVPHPVIGLLLSMPDDYELAQEADQRIAIRPRAIDASIANIDIETAQLKISLILRPVSSPEQAAAQVVIRRRRTSEGAPVDWRRELWSQLGYAHVGDDRSRSRDTGHTWLMGASARMSRRTQAWWMLDLTATLAYAGPARFDHTSQEAMHGGTLYTGTMQRDQLVARVLAGLSVRRSPWPWLRLGVGVQGRRLRDSVLELGSSAVVPGPPGDWALDALIAVGAEYELEVRSQPISVGVQATWAPYGIRNGSLSSIESSLRVYWF